MAEPFLGEIRIMSFNFAPKGWAQCNGQTLPIAQNQALYALLGTTYGGNGQTTFGLPDLRGRAPIHRGAGFTIGERAGEESHSVSISEMPMHTHFGVASAAAANAASPAGNRWADGGKAIYAASQDASAAAMDVTLVSTVGGSQAHTNMPPYLTLNFCIAVAGIFPSQT
jgi:microcystin-dependent protein